MLKMFKKFMQDPNAWDMYITGRAGTGKTTDLSYLVDYCLAKEIDSTVAAFTHKACGILATKLSPQANIMTLHKFLNKRPTINGNAVNKKHISSNCQVGDTKKTTVLFVDEYSMVGEKDLMDLRADDIKIVWLGDPYQLPPVGDAQSVAPSGPYCITLTEIKRQAKDNPLGQTLEQLVGMIEGNEPAALLPNANFKRQRNLVSEYKDGDIILCYTNERVQELNAQIQSYTKPLDGDVLFSPTTQQQYNFVRWDDYPASIELPFGDTLELNSKFKTLEYMIKNKTKFAVLRDQDGHEITMAAEFGHYDYKVKLDELKQAAADSNRAIEEDFPGTKAAAWVKANKNHPLARRRAKAWRDFLSFNDSVICLDFSHAMTVHKSQGSTYPRVLVDTDDIHKAAYFSFLVYLKLMYVALSRASKEVITC